MQGGGVSPLTDRGFISITVEARGAPRGARTGLLTLDIGNLHTVIDLKRA